MTSWRGAGVLRRPLGRPGPALEGFGGLAGGAGQSGQAGEIPADAAGGEPAGPFLRSQA